MDSAATVHLAPASSGDETGSAAALDDALSPSTVSDSNASGAAHFPLSSTALRAVPPTPAAPTAPVTSNRRNIVNFFSTATAASTSSAAEPSAPPQKAAARQQSQSPFRHAGEGIGGAAGPSRPLSVRALHDKQEALEAAFFASLTIFAEKGVRKGLQPLCDAGYVQRTAPGIADFLRLCGHEVAVDAEIGDYLGDEGRGPDDAALARGVRRAFLGALNFAGLPFDTALRVLLTRAGFRLPGEAQKVRLRLIFACACGDGWLSMTYMRGVQHCRRSPRSLHRAD